MEFEDKRRKKDIFEYKRKKDIVARKIIADNLMNKNPDKIPVIVEKDPTSRISGMNKSRFLVEKKSTVNKFILEIKELIKMKEEEAVFLTAKGKYSLSGSKFFEDIYKSYKDEDGFLYIMYSTELMFG